MFSLIRPAKVEGHGGRVGHIHHRQGGELLQLLRRRGGEGTESQKSEEQRRRRRGRDLQGSPSDTRAEEGRGEERGKGG